ncbi:hypothetical protein [Pelagibacterium lacus]|uniref:Uncharacterized protein n=1 Tax=Pelagibacterium lacus TaxID=2282655 RepID=A0A369W7S7_9HYPH|nr:hypothetical protein [Pelagibacterium lacus]RDE09895.1 hypothetical protein DVH29_05015 [Pelagibacterium lacus]
MTNYTRKVKQHRAGFLTDERYRLQPSDFDSYQDYWEWRAGEPDFDAIEATEEEEIARIDADLRRQS